MEALVFGPPHRPQACRLCAVQYVVRSRRCWAVDCGTPTAVTDLVLLKVRPPTLLEPSCRALTLTLILTPRDLTLP